MALRATEEPRLMRLMTTPKRKETMTALRGIGNLGETCRVRNARIRFCCSYETLCHSLTGVKRKWRRRDRI